MYRGEGREFRKMAGYKRPQDESLAISPMQQQVMSRVDGLTFCQQPSGDIPTPEGALKQLLRGGAPYDMGPINDALASYQAELVSLPQDCHECPQFTRASC